ncbi:LLM class flavin-dependent oxidoreductase [Actinomadura sp. NPDC049753]|uniref:LLM class flavin-dependent oxidoreductase n=1 Tax=Actinomadura sp. NPDC049753 TaxID=3154739 RepID=UPI00342583FD
MDGFGGAGLPIYVGGSSPAAARRAGRHGDGFIPRFAHPGPAGRDPAAPRRTRAEDAREGGRRIEVRMRAGAGSGPRSWHGSGPYPGPVPAVASRS